MNRITAMALICIQIEPSSRQWTEPREQYCNANNHLEGIRIQWSRNRLSLSRGNILKTTFL